MNRQPPTPEEMEETKRQIRAENESQWASGNRRVKCGNSHRKTVTQDTGPIIYNFSSRRLNGKPI